MEISRKRHGVRLISKGCLELSLANRQGRVPSLAMVNSKTFHLRIWTPGLSQYARAPENKYIDIFYKNLALPSYLTSLGTIPTKFQPGYDASGKSQTSSPPLNCIQLFRKTHQKKSQCCLGRQPLHLKQCCWPVSSAPLPISTQHCRHPAPPGSEAPGLQQRASEPCSLFCRSIMNVSLDVGKVGELYAAAYLDRRLLVVISRIVERGVESSNLGVIGDVMDPLDNL